MMRSLYSPVQWRAKRDLTHLASPDPAKNRPASFSPRLARIATRWQSNRIHQEILESRSRISLVLTGHPAMDLISGSVGWQADPWAFLRCVHSIIHRRATSASYVFKNRSKSSVSCCWCVTFNPCGAPSYSFNVELEIPFAAGRPLASIGTVLSAVP